MSVRDPDAVVGWGATLFGTGGLTLQVLTDFGSLALIVVNLLLAMGGGYLLILRIIKAHRELKQPPSDNG